MPREARIKGDDLTYHIVTRGNNKMQAFHDDEDYNKYYDILRKYKKEIPFELYHFCLMSNHPHLLIKPNFDISRLMHKINLSYAQYYKNRYKHIGHFWQDRFKSHIVSQDEYILRCARYIETNPERTISKIPAEGYPYSSYRYYAFGEKCDIITENPLYNEFGNTPDEKRTNYIAFIKERETDQNLIKPKSQFIASQEYIENLLNALKLKRRKRGRPRKIRQN
jgi:putative transposase